MNQEFVQKNIIKIAYIIDDTLNSLNQDYTSGNISYEQYEYMKYIFLNHLYTALTGLKVKEA